MTVGLKVSLRKFCGRHHELVWYHAVSVHRLRRGLDFYHDTQVTRRIPHVEEKLFDTPGEHEFTTGYDGVPLSRLFICIFAYVDYLLFVCVPLFNGSHVFALTWNIFSRLCIKVS